MLAIQRNKAPSFLALLALPATAMGFALSVQISALSWILTTRYGLHIDEIGLVWAAGPVAGIVGQLAVGLLSDDAWFLEGVGSITAIKPWTSFTRPMRSDSKSAHARTAGTIL